MPVMQGTIEKRRSVMDRVSRWSFPTRMSGICRRWRRPILYVTGFGFIDAAAFNLHLVAGLLAVGMSLFILEALSDDRRPA